MQPTLIIMKFLYLYRAIQLYVLRWDVIMGVCVKGTCTEEPSTTNIVYVQH